MAFNIRDKSLDATLERHLSKASRDNADAMEKLSSGIVFSKADPRPAERALAEGLEFRLRSLAASRSNINNAVNLLQTAESAFSEIGNIILRMKEINLAASNTTLADKERKFLFIEYEALHDEINRIALSTEFNGLPLLNGNDPRMPESLVFRLGDPLTGADSSNSDNINQIVFDGLKSLVATTQGLGIRSARELLSSSQFDDGVSTDDAISLLVSEDPEQFATVYDQALNLLTSQRSIYGAFQTRMKQASDFMDVYEENLQAAKSSIADVDYAKEVSNLVESRMLLQAGTAMLAQGNINSRLALNLLQAID